MGPPAPTLTTPPARAAAAPALPAPLRELPAVAAAVILHGVRIRVQVTAGTARAQVAAARAGALARAGASITPSRHGCRRLP